LVCATAKATLASLPKEIEVYEQAIETLREQVNAPDFFKQESDVTQSLLNELEEKEAALEAAFERWEYLENLENNQQ